MTLSLLFAALLGGATSDEAACADVGGTCSAVGDCGVGAGLLAEPSCGAAHLVCCLPVSACPTEDFSCTDGSACFRPSCTDGELVCAEGQSRAEEGFCETLR